LTQSPARCRQRNTQETAGCRRLCRAVPGYSASLLGSGTLRSDWRLQIAGPVAGTTLQRHQVARTDASSPRTGRLRHRPKAMRPSRPLAKRHGYGIRLQPALYWVLGRNIVAWPRLSAPSFGGSAGISRRAGTKPPSTRTESSLGPQAQVELPTKVSKPEGGH